MQKALALVAFFLPAAPATALELSRTEHPRMLFYAADDAKQIHTRIHDHPWYLEIKRHLPQMYESNFEVAGRQLEAKAAVYVVERSQGFDEKFYRQAVGWLRTENLPHDPWNGSNCFVIGQSFLLDALWNDMEAQGDTSTRDAAIRVVIDTVNFLNRHVDASPWVCCDYGNQGFLRMLPVYPVAILLRGHEPWKEQVDAWWRRMEDFAGGKRDWYAAAHQMTRGGGGWPEGPSYHSYCAGVISMVTAAIHSATTWGLVDGGAGTSRNDVLRQSEYYLWTMLPGRRYFNLDNGPNSPSIRWGEKQFHFCAYGLAGPSKSLTKYLVDKNPPGRYGKDVSGPFVLGYDPAIPKLDLDALPGSRVFAGEFDGREYPNGAGTFVWRSGWDEHATVLIMQARNRYAGHQHADAGSFYLFREGFLVTENAGKQKAASEHHNTYLINGKGMIHGNNPHKVYRVLEGTPYDEGDVLAHEASARYSYAKVAFGRSFPAKPTIAHRQIVVLEPPQGRPGAGDAIIVVADHVRTAAETRKSFLMHTRKKPSGLGTETVTASDGAGRLFARVLLPTGTTWRGEPNGNAYRNRIESRGSDHHLLAVLQASTASTKEMVKTETVSGVRGLLVADRCVVFAGEDLGQGVRFSHPNRHQRHFYVICGLPPGQKYGVSVVRRGDGVGVSLERGSDDLTSSRAGVVAFYSPHERQKSRNP